MTNRNVLKKLHFHEDVKLKKKIWTDLYLLRGEPVALSGQELLQAGEATNSRC